MIHSKSKYCSSPSYESAQKSNNRQTKCRARNYVWNSNYYDIITIDGHGFGGIAHLQRTAQTITRLSIWWRNWHIIHQYQQQQHRFRQSSSVIPEIIESGQFKHIGRITRGKKWASFYGEFDLKAHPHFQNVRRWSQSLTSASKTKQHRTINMMPSRLQKRKLFTILFLFVEKRLNQEFNLIGTSFSWLPIVPTALSLDGLHRIVDCESEFDHFVQEIEQYDYLMENSANATEIRK